MSQRETSHHLSDLIRDKCSHTLGMDPYKTKKFKDFLKNQN